MQNDIEYLVLMKNIIQFIKPIIRDIIEKAKITFFKTSITSDFKSFRHMKYIGRIGNKKKDIPKKVPKKNIFIIILFSQCIIIHNIK